MKECPYPDLFSPRTLECDEFTRVTCDKVPEPQAPCKCYDYTVLRLHSDLTFIPVVTVLVSQSLAGMEVKKRINGSLKKTFSEILEKNRFL